MRGIVPVLSQVVVVETGLSRTFLVTLLIFGQTLIDGCHLRASADSTVEKTYAGSVQIEFLGTSTLHDFKGLVDSDDILIKVGPETWSAQASVESEAMDTKSRGRDRKMHRMLESREHPLIQGRVIGAPRNVGGGGEVTLLLRVRKKEIGVPLKIVSWSEAGGQLIVQGEGAISLKEFGLRPPSILFGAVKVGDRVVLKLSIESELVNEG